jgi:phage shock protein PspC (stress-responsive transcriptional regulator)
MAARQFMKVSNQRSYCSSSASCGGEEGTRAGIVEPADVDVVVVEVVAVVVVSVVGSGSTVVVMLWLVVILWLVVVGSSVVSSGQLSSSLPSRQSAILSQT